MRSSIFTSLPPNQFNDLEKRLGEGARLSLSFLLLDAEGRLIANDGYRQQELVPMASTKKIAIALAIMKKILSEKTLKLEDSITFNESDYSPGLPGNPLDQYYFNLAIDYPPQTKTNAELMRYMLTKSDNTASDMLLKLAGGAHAVTQFMHELGINDYLLIRNSAQLLGDYYQFSPQKSAASVAKLQQEVPRIFALHDTEFSMFTHGEDCCSANDMSELLHFIYCASLQNDSSWWPCEASQTILALMQQCTTGANRIKRALQDVPGVKSVANKTGSLGGIANDTAVMKFENGVCAILTINTAFSPASIEVREQVMTDAARVVVGKVSELLHSNLPGCVL